MRTKNEGREQSAEDRGFTKAGRRKTDYASGLVTQHSTLIWGEGAIFSINRIGERSTKRAESRGLKSQVMGQKS